MSRPSDTRFGLDLVRGFEAAARHLSFTKAAAELFLTQSAISRQIQSLEQQLGVVLFTRRGRGLALTDAGQQLYGAADRALRILQDAADSIAPAARQRMVTVTSSMAFCSLWLIPRLSAFRRAHPDVDVRISADNQVLDLDRERIDVAIRYCPVSAAPPSAVRMFGEEIVPVCSPTLLEDPSRPLDVPLDLARHTLLHFEHAENTIPWLAWRVWLESAGVADLRAAGALHFSHYDQVIAAARNGQGVAIGRRQLIGNLLETGALVSLFASNAVTDRAYFVVRTDATRHRGEVDDFAAWLIAEAAGHPAFEQEPPSAGKRIR